MQTLSYAQDRLTYRWRRKGRQFIIWTALAIIAVLACWGVHAVYVRASFLYWQHRVATFGPIPLGKSRSVAIDAEANNCWSSYTNAVWRFGTYVPVGSASARPTIVFMHEMVCPNSRHEIVELAVDLDNHGSYDLLWRTVEHNGFSEPGTYRNGLEGIGFSLRGHMVIDSVALDASDASHLLVHGHKVGDNASPEPFGVYIEPPNLGPQNLDLRLQNDGTFNIVRR